jgi:hypothetical protein
MKQVHAASDPMEANLIRGLLEARGIAAVVLEEGMIGDFPAVWVVDDTDFLRARTLVAELSDRPNGAGTPVDDWHCLRCGERIEASFAVCWRCGASHPEIA